jgi:hypothetical protein
MGTEATIQEVNNCPNCHLLQIRQLSLELDIIGLKAEVRRLELERDNWRNRAEAKERKK